MKRTIITLMKNIFLITTFCVLTGCAETIPFTLDVALPVPKKSMPAIEVASVDLEEGGTRLVNIGTYRLGEFNQKDLSVLHESLYNTIFKAVNDSHSLNAQPQPTLKVHVVIRKHLLATSNTGGAVLACVAWCVTTEEDSLIYEEQFYASNKVYLLGSPRGMKQSVHRSIVRRIVETTLLLGVSTDKTEIASVVVKGTHNSFEEAVQNLPGSLTSLYGLIPTAHAEIDWKWAECPENIDWHAFLAEKKD